MKIHYYISLKKFGHEEHFYFDARCFSNGFVL